MSNLFLILKGEWYRKIEKGFKTSEYREIKPYWTKRLFNKQYKTVTFALGYAKDRPTMTFDIEDICITHEPNDLNLPKCYEIKLKDKIIDILYAELDKVRHTAKKVILSPQVIRRIELMKQSYTYSIMCSCEHIARRYQSFSHINFEISHLIPENTWEII